MIDYNAKENKPINTSNGFFLQCPQQASTSGYSQHYSFVHHDRAKYLGEKVFPKNTFYDGRKCHSEMSYPSSDERDRIPSGILEVGATSSSSSQDWIEELDSKATVKVLEEFKRMELVLCCLKPIPKNYDGEEYHQWIIKFPWFR